MREVIAVLGKTGHGKSVWTRKFCASKPRLFVFDPLLDFPCEYLDEQKLIERYDDGYFDLGKSFQVGSGTLADLDLLGALAMLAGNSLLVVEECAIAFDKYSRLEPWIRDLVFLGRHRDCGILVTAQRAASVPIDLRSQLSRLVTFAQSEGDDLSWLKPMLGQDVKDLPLLPPLECIDASNFEKSRYTITP